MGIKINYGGSSLSSGLNRASVKLGAVVLMYSATKASELEAKMKVNRPWTDRTGMAKALLSAKVSRPDTNTVRITLSHGVNYGMWLELAHEKRFAIVAPTVREEGPRLVEGLSGIMSNLKF